MITICGNKRDWFNAEIGQFGDGTLKCPSIRLSELVGGYYNNHVDIMWNYDNDAELFALQCIVQDLREQELNLRITLHLPYIPHARQDRYVSGRLFTLKYFAQVINAMQFQQVLVNDPHSDVSLALIDRCVNTADYNADLLQTLHHLASFEEMTYHQKIVGIPDVANNIDELCLTLKWQIMYPDAGAAKKYGANESNIVGIKTRNNDGRISSYDLQGLREGTEVVIIRDDICSYGGTFVSAAKELKARGVKRVYLVLTHCENNIMKGEALDILDGVSITDSIFTLKHNSQVDGVDDETYRRRFMKISIRRKYR